MDERWLLLALIVTAGIAVEAALGFGSALIIVGVGANLIPLEEILPAFIPLNLGLSSWIVARNHRDVDRVFLLRRLLPFMALGLPIGLLAFTRLPQAELARGLGVFLIALVAIDVWRIIRPAEPRPLPRPAELGLLLLGGAIHGAFGTGGPIAVYVGKRSLDDKRRFRATLSSLWMILNAAVIVGYLVAGRLSAQSLLHSLMLAPALIVGSWLGQKIHDRVPERTFQRLVLAVLLAAAVSAVAR